MHIRLLILTLLALGLPSGGEVRAQSGYRFEAIVGEDGLGQRPVTAIIQDRQGFLWFGTEDGLYRFDGVRSTVFHHVPGDTTSLASSRITTLAEDAAGRLWVGTQGGLSLLNPRSETFRTVRGAPGREDGRCGSFVKALAATDDGAIWSGTLTGPLCRKGPDETRFRSIERTGMRDEMGLMSVYTLVPQPGGGLLVSAAPQPCRVASSSDLVCRSGIESEVEGTQQFVLVGDSIYSVINAVPRGRSLLQQFQQGRWTLRETLPVILSVEPQSTLWIDGAFWLGTESGGIARYTLADGVLQLLQPGPEESGLPGGRVRAIYQDRQGFVWVAANEGLARWHPDGERFERFQQMDAPGTLSTSQVNGITTTRDGTIWVATQDGLNELDDTTGRFTVHRRSGDRYEHANAFWWLYEDRLGRLLVGSRRLGVFIFDRTTERFVRDEALNAFLGRETEQEGGQMAIRHITEDRAGRLWISTTAGIALYDLERQDGDLLPNRTPRFPGYYANVIHQDAAGTIWLGTDVGLCRFDEAGVRFDCLQRGAEVGLTAPVIWSIADDPVEEDLLWVGTVGGGLCAYRPGAAGFQCVTTADGLPSNSVFGVLTDGRGHLWLSTAAGLVRFHPRTRTVQVYTAADGLQGDAFDLMSYHRDAQGRMYFGGRHGFNRFHPDGLRPSTYEPPVVLTGVRVLDRPRQSIGPSGDTLRLAYDENYVAVHFAALDFSNPAKNQYRYRLLGYQDEWRPTDGRSPLASYTRVAPGTYTFEVQGSNHDGIFSDEVARLTIDIIPAYWQTRAFRWGSGLFLLFGLGTFITIAYTQRRRREAERRKEQQEVQRRLAESRERERQRIARELHDGPIQLLYRVGLDLDALSTEANGQQASVQAVRGEVNTVANELREVLSALRPPVIAHLGLGPALQSLVRRFARTHPTMTVACHVRVSGQDWPEDIQHTLYRVAQEALTNVGKHAEAGMVVVDLSEEDGHGVLTVRDDGHGFRKPPRLVELARADHFGLVGAVERMEGVGGALTVDTGPGRGTLIHASVPLAEAMGGSG